MPYDIETVRRLRGFDPEFGDYSRQNVIVESAVRDVAEWISRKFRRAGDVIDLCGPASVGRQVPSDAWFVFQLVGHRWTQAQSERDMLGESEIQEISRVLKTMTFSYDYENTGGADGFSLFDHGELIESFSRLSDNPIYTGEEGQRFLAERLNAGYRVSRDHSTAYYSRRGRELDVESMQECNQIRDCVLHELGAYIAETPWSINRSNEVQLSPEWPLECFAGAFLVIPPEPEPRPAGPSPKLRFD